MKTIQKPEKTDVTPVYTNKVIRHQIEDKANDANTENIRVSVYAKQLNLVLSNVQEYIDDKKFEDYIFLQWIIIFDRIDMFFLIVFNTVNVVMSIFLFKY